MGKPIYGDTVGGGGGNLKKIPQSDWNQTDETQLDYIKNKPTILTDEDIENIIEESGGATFVPSVSNDGILSWTNDKGLENPTPVNVVGPKGDAYTLTEGDKGEIIECISEGLIPQQEEAEQRWDLPEYRMYGADNEYKLVGEPSDFENEDASIRVILNSGFSPNGVPNMPPVCFIKNMPAPQSNFATFKFINSEVDDGGNGILNYEYCGKLYTAKILYSTPEGGRVTEDEIQILGCRLLWGGKVYVVDSTIIPKYEVTDEVKTEITNMVLNEMERAEDWVL